MTITCGEEYLKVARSLLKTEDATDQEIASSTGLRINMVRRVLYDLFGKGLITGVRAVDEKKGYPHGILGDFVYRWRWITTMVPSKYILDLENQLQISNQNKLDEHKKDVDIIIGSR